MSKTDDATRRKRQARRRKWRDIFVVFGGLFQLGIFVVLGYRAYFLHQADRRLREAIAQIESVDPDWCWESILDKREVVPDEQNSAPVVLEVEKLLPRNWPDKPAVETTLPQGDV